MDNQDNDQQDTEQQHNEQQSNEQQAIEQWIERFNQMAQRLNHSQMDPHPTQAAQHKAAIESFASEFLRDVIEPMNEVLRKLDNPEEADQLKNIIAATARDAAGACAAAGATSTMKRLLSAVRDVAPSDFLRDEARQAERNPEAFAWLSWGRHLADNAKFGASQKAYKKAKDLLKDEDGPNRSTFGTFIDKAKSFGAAVGRMPSLSTVNGIGGGFWGSRERWPDGSYITTHSIVFFFLPIFPLASYRVAKSGDGYTVMRRYPLSRFASLSRLIVPAIILFFIGSGVLSSYLNNPNRLAGQMIAEAQTAQEAGDTDEAIKIYKRVFSQFTYRSQDALFDAADGYVPLLIAQVQQAPAIEEDVAPYKKAIRDLNQVPAAPRQPWTPKFIDALSTKLTPADTIERARAADEIITFAADKLGKPAEALAPVRKAARTIVAQSYEASAPQKALSLWLANRDHEGAARVLSTMPLRDPGLVNAMAPHIAKLKRLSKGKHHGALLDKLQRAVDKAKAAVANQSRTAALTGDAKIALSFLKKHPGDQAVAGHAASLMSSQGKAKKAIAFLKKHTTEGWLLPDQRRTKGYLLFDLGQLPESEMLLAELLKTDLPQYQKAIRAFRQKAEGLEQKYIRQAEQGLLPPQLQQKVNTASQEEANRVFWEYANKKIAEDEGLAKARTAVEEKAHVVDLAVSLGMVRLQLAQQAEGKAQRKWLSGAEKAFLAVREESQGSPYYHLSLGEVFYRLGKQAEGEQEFKTVLAMKQEMLTLQVGRTYRNLGESHRAEEVLTQGYQSASTKQLKYAFAYMIALLRVGSVDEETWLERADPKNPEVKLQLSTLKAERLLDEGKLKAADAEFAKVVQGHLARGEESAAYNNAAGVMSRRFVTTGAVKHLRTSTLNYRKALKKAPQNAIVSGNLARAVALERDVTALDQFLDLGLLRPNRSEASSLVEAFQYVPKAKKAMDARDDSPLVAELLKVGQLTLTLAPTNPEGYDLVSPIYQARKDKDALSKLHDKAKTLSFDAENDRRFIEEYVDRGADPEAAAALAQRVSDIRAILPRADKMTRAAAYTLIGRNLRMRADLTASAADAKAAAQAYREARKLVSDLDVAGSEAAALEVEAILQVAEKNDTVLKAFNTDIRRLDYRLWLLDRAKAGDGVIGDITESAPFKQALSLRQGLKPRSIGASSAVIAQVVGDDKLLDRARRQIGTDASIPMAALNAALRPGSDAAQKWNALLQSMN